MTSKFIFGAVQWWCPAWFGEAQRKGQAIGCLREPDDPEVEQHLPQQAVLIPECEIGDAFQGVEV